jgi:hypothetical protein
MEKQTAVEWLYEELWKQTDFSLPNNILEKAKEMEKKQIEDLKDFDVWKEWKNNSEL